MRANPVLVFALAALIAAPLVPTAAGDGCDAYPIGRCGTSDRESIVFCYVVVKNEMKAGTVDATAVGPLLVRSAPTEAFAADPMNAAAPFESAYRDVNGIPGLQPKAVTCGQFIWFAECNSWMGPYNQFGAIADERVI